jgi:hypothetical protein
MIVYRKPAPLALLSCGHHAPRGAVCAHRSHRSALAPAVRDGVVRLRRGESVVIARCA